MMTLSIKKSQVLFLVAVSIGIVCCANTWAQSKFPASEWMKRDTRFKLKVMREVIAQAKRDSIIIRFSPEYYMKEVDAVIENAIRNRDEKCLDTSVGIMIHTIAAMDGDWDNGESKLEHARKWLGPTHLEHVKKLFPQKYARLLSERSKESDPWKHLGHSENLLIRYDVASLSHVSKSVVRVWTKTEYVDVQEGLNDLKKRGLYKPDYEKYDHNMQLYKIDCTGKTFAILANYYYKKDGSLIDAFDFPERVEDIGSHSSVIGVLSKAVCAELRETKESDTEKREGANAGVN